MKSIKSYILVFALIFCFSCDDLGKMSNQIDQVKDTQSQILLQQDKILKALVALEKKVSSPSKNPSKPQNNKRKTPNPNISHNIDIGGSVVLGNPDAKVAVTKFTDFQ